MRLRSLVLTLVLLAGWAAPQPSLPQANPPAIPDFVSLVQRAGSLVDLAVRLD